MEKLVFIDGPSSSVNNAVESCYAGEVKPENLLFLIHETRRFLKDSQTLAPAYDIVDVKSGRPLSMHLYKTVDSAQRAIQGIYHWRQENGTEPQGVTSQDGKTGATQQAPASKRHYAA